MTKKNRLTNNNNAYKEPVKRCDTYSCLKAVHTRFSDSWSSLFHSFIRQRFCCFLSLSLADLAKSAGRAVRKMCSHIPEKKLDTQKRGPTAERGREGGRHQ